MFLSIHLFTNGRAFDYVNETSMQKNFFRINQQFEILVLKTRFLVLLFVITEVDNLRFTNHLKFRAGSRKIV